MGMKKVLGWTGIIAISFIPVLLWFMFGAGTSEFGNYADATHALGELFGLVGMTMFALTFVLSTRWRFMEDIFEGLDKVYLVHGVLGGTALIFILFHPIFLVLKFIPQDINQAAAYILPSSYWSVNFGIISLLGMILLIFLTIFVRLRYNTWKFTHEFLGLMFLLAVFHIFMVRGTASKDLIFSGYYIYATVVSIIGLYAFSYSLFLKNRLQKTAPYVIKNIRKQKDYFDITLSPEYKPLRYKAGQFVFVRFYNQRLSKEAHPFTIASGSEDINMRIVVKILGDHTSRFDNLKIGDKVSIEGPYGRFDYEKYDYKNQVWLGAGVGIAPFLGMAEDIPTNKYLKGNIDLYYSVSDGSDFVGLDRLRYVAERIKKFRILPWDSGKKGHLTTEDIIKISGDLHEKEFFLCGSNRFKNSLISGLLNNGVHKSHIHEEAFDFL